jgi:hypothetical protein
MKTLDERLGGLFGPGPAIGDPLPLARSHGSSPGESAPRLPPSPLLGNSGGSHDALVEVLLSMRRRGDAIQLAQAAADMLAQLGDQETAARILTAIEPRRPRGAPARWSFQQRFDLYLAAIEALRRNPSLSERSVFAHLARMEPWRRWSGAALKDVYRRFLKDRGTASLVERPKKIRAPVADKSPN